MLLLHFSSEKSDSMLRQHFVIMFTTSRHVEYYVESMWNMFFFFMLPYNLNVLVFPAVHAWIYCRYCIPI